MSEFWCGLYLKTNLRDSTSAFRRYIRKNNFEIILEMEDIQTVITHGNYDTLTSFNLFFLQYEQEWIYVTDIGNTAASPKPFYLSAIIGELGCDAFYCGYNDTYYWWYDYYQKGKLVDRFSSDPWEEIYTRYWLDINDPRKNFYEQPDSVKEAILSQFNGDYSKIKPLLKPDTTEEDINKRFNERWPERSFPRLSKYFIFPLNQYITAGGVIGYILEGNKPEYDFGDENYKISDLIKRDFLGLEIQAV